MSARRQFERSVSFVDPFLGDVWLRVSRATQSSVVHVAASVARAWDTEVVIDASDAALLAEALGDAGLTAAKGTTLDGESAVIVAEDGRLVFAIPGERLGDVVTLGEQTGTVRACLDAAAQLDGEDGS
jgi:hypothetical protein